MGEIRLLFLTVTTNIYNRESFLGVEVILGGTRWRVQG